MLCPIKNVHSKRKKITMPNKERLIKLLVLAAIICVVAVVLLNKGVSNSSSDGAKAACEFQNGAGNCVKSAATNEWVARGSR